MYDWKLKLSRLVLILTTHQCECHRYFDFIRIVVSPSGCLFVAQLSRFSLEADFVQPICLPPRQLNRKKDTLRVKPSYFVAGWGSALPGKLSTLDRHFPSIFSRCGIFSANDGRPCVTMFVFYELFVMRESAVFPLWWMGEFFRLGISALFSHILWLSCAFKFHRLATKHVDTIQTSHRRKIVLTAWTYDRRKWK